MDSSPLWLSQQADTDNLESATLHCQACEAYSTALPACDPLYCPDDKVRRYLVYLKYWTLHLDPLTVYPKVLFPQNFIIKPPLKGCWVLPHLL